MPTPRDLTMLRADSTKMLVAMAEKEYEPEDLAIAAGVSKNTVYVMRLGFYVKPKYIGKVAKALEVRVVDLIADAPEQWKGAQYDHSREAATDTAKSESTEEPV